MIPFMKSKMRSKMRKGQSLIEAMVALSVLMVGFVGIMSLLSRSFFYERDISDSMKATYLAAEGIELTKNLIDHDMTVFDESAGGGAGGWGTCFANIKDFELDSTITNCTQLIPYISNSNLPLDFDSHSHLYGYNLPAYGYSMPNGTPTNFQREIKITPNGNDEITVDSIVTWSTGTITNQNVHLEDHFYNWQPHL